MGGFLERERHRRHDGEFDWTYLLLVLQIPQPPEPENLSRRLAPLVAAAPIQRLPWRDGRSVLEIPPGLILVFVVLVVLVVIWIQYSGFSDDWRERQDGRLLVFAI